MNDAAAAQQQPPLFNIEKLFVKDLSLEIPHAPGIFLERAQPQIDMQLSSQAATVEEGVYEVNVTATITARMTEKNLVAFLIEVKQAGVFVVRNMPHEELEQVLAIVCPNILYPFLREAVSDMSVRAGFSPVLLNPVNFEAMYHQQKLQQTTA
ncbi:MAG: protein-export chaperone SecB [Gallionellaceae bacterium]